MPRQTHRQPPAPATRILASTTLPLLDRAQTNTLEPDDTFFNEPFAAPPLRLVSTLDLASCKCKRKSDKQVPPEPEPERRGCRAFGRRIQGCVRRCLRRCCRRG